MANGNFGQCSGCGARVIWIKTEAGKNMPCNPTLHNYKIDQTGKEKIVTQTGKVVTGVTGVNSPGRVPPLPVGYEQPPERCLCSYGGLGLPVCNDNYLAERQGWAGTVLPGNDRTLFVRNHQKETAV